MPSCLPPPDPIAALLNPSIPLDAIDMAALAAHLDPPDPRLAAYEFARAFRLRMQLTDSVSRSIARLDTLQEDSESPTEQRRAATTLTRLFSSLSRPAHTPTQVQRTQAAAGASPPSSSPTAPSTPLRRCEATPRHLGTSAPSSVPPSCLRASVPSCLPSIPHSSYHPAPEKWHGLTITPSDTDIPPEAVLKRITDGPPDPYHLRSPDPEKLPTPPPEATPRDVVRAQLRAVRRHGGAVHPQATVAALFDSLAPSVQSQGHESIPDALNFHSVHAFRATGVRCTIDQPTEIPIDPAIDPAIEGRQDHQPTTPPKGDQPLRAATVRVTHHCPPVRDHHCTFHLILHNPTTDPANPKPPIWLTTRIEPNTS